jgi:hypothetical protein
MTAYKSFHAAVLSGGCFSVVVAAAWTMIMMLSYCLYCIQTDCADKTSFVHEEAWVNSLCRHPGEGIALA